MITLVVGDPFAAWDKDDAPKNELLVDSNNRVGVLTDGDEWVVFTKAGVEVVGDIDDLRFCSAVGAVVTIAGPPRPRSAGG